MLLYFIFREGVLSALGLSRDDDASSTLFLTLMVMAIVFAGIGVLAGTLIGSIFKGKGGDTEG